jgi:hypothetical protein
MKTIISIKNNNKYIVYFIIKIFTKKSFSQHLPKSILTKLNLSQIKKPTAQSSNLPQADNPYFHHYIEQPKDKHHR